MGPPESAIDAPVGAAVSFVSVNVEVVVPFPPLYEVTVCVPEALVLWSHVNVPVYGLEVSSPPPVIPETERSSASGCRTGRRSRCR